MSSLGDLMTTLSINANTALVRQEDDSLSLVYMGKHYDRSATIPSHLLYDYDNSSKLVTAADFVASLMMKDFGAEATWPQPAIEFIFPLIHAAGNGIKKP